MSSVTFGATNGYNAATQASNAGGGEAEGSHHHHHHIFDDLLGKLSGGSEKSGDSDPKTHG